MMIKRIMLLTMILAVMIAAGMSCKVVNYAAQDIILTVTIDRSFDVNSDNTEYYDSQRVNMADVFEEIDFASVEEITISSIELIVTRNNMGTGTTASGQISFNRVNNPMPLNAVLASFSNINLSNVLNQPLTPFSALALLNINATGLERFKEAASALEPVDFYFSGTVSQPPVDFAARIIITIQVRMSTA